jgi:hypothetical protein
MNAIPRRALRAITLSLLLGWTTVQAAEIDPARIGEASGAVAKAQPDGVVRIGWSRDDVAVTVDGVRLAPAAGLGSWAAFMPMDENAMLMGDTVVFEDEVDAAMDAAFKAGLDVTGLHNHFFFDSPKVYFMHIGGHGDPMRLAGGVKAVWDAIKAVREQRPQPATGFGGPVPTAGKIDADAISQAIGHRPDITGEVVKVTIGREGRMHGRPVGGSMGLTTWAAFTGSDRLAAVDGDVIMTAEEVQPPAFYFVHFWGKGPVAELAQGFRRVLDAQRAHAKPAAR